MDEGGNGILGAEVYFKESPKDVSFTGMNSGFIILILWMLTLWRVNIFTCQLKSYIEYYRLFTTKVFIEIVVIIKHGAVKTNNAGI